jgi:tRNA nucleotidyltransferase (CCA-adding enzyme)
LFHWLRDLPVEILLHMMARTGREEIRRHISTFVTQLSNVKTSITGNDLQKLGVPKGPAYRAILDTVLDARLDGVVAGREDELALAASLLAKMQSNGAAQG